MHPTQRIVHAPGKMIYVTALDDNDEFGEHGRCDFLEDGFDGGEEVGRRLLLGQGSEKEGRRLDL